MNSKADSNTDNILDNTDDNSIDDNSTGDSTLDSTIDNAVDRAVDSTSDNTREYTEETEARSPNPDQESELEKSHQPTTSVVAIGASAGGLAALKTLLATVPEDSNTAYVVVVHLSPEHNSQLAELLQPHVSIPIQQVTGSVPLEPNRVYVIPPGKNLSSIDSHLRLSALEPKRRERAPVDHFFRTLAKSHDGHSVGIILTGTGCDGTLGIQEIKDKGGLTIVQSPSEAEYDGMPRSALSMGTIDLVLPLNEMIKHVLLFLSTQPKLALPRDDNDDELPQLQQILALVRTHKGSDFTRYKRSTIMRRVRRRMQLAHIEEVDDYVQFLHANSEEISALANDFLITVTSFFRDESVFKELEQKLIPELFKDKHAGDSIRVWSVGCSTGEEAYSIAILLLEYADNIQSPPQIQIFASDLHENSLKKAREGLYPGDIEADVTSARLDRFFHKENGSYRIKSEVRELVVFSPHNLLADPPFSKVDLIVCRNLLIYLQRNLQHDVFQLFHYALKPKGILVLGTAESVNQSDLFITENKANGIYLKRNVPCPEPRLPVFPLTRFANLKEPGQPPRTGESLSYGELHYRMVERYAQPSILVNSQNKVVHLSHHAGRYMTHPGGTPTTSVFKLIHEDLQAELRSVLTMSAERRAPAASRPVSLRIDGQVREVTLHVRPSTKEEEEAFTLIIFDEREPMPADTEDKNGERSSAAAAKELEIELELTKRRLQTAIDEYETSQEEMRASNEELQSANEELRSTLEELETSKEELQSINEELQTANQENRHKVAELGQLSDDLQHLMTATHIATLFLDRKFRILRFTPQIGELFNLRAVDRGRPLSDLTHRLHYDDLMEDAARVLAQLIPSEREVKDDKDNWYLARMRPYRTADDHIDGLVLTFVDITARRKSELALRQSEERYRTLFESMDEGFCVVEQLGSGEDEQDFRILEANPAFLKLTGLPNVMGQTITNIAPAQLSFWKEVCGGLDTQTTPFRFECSHNVFGRYLEIYAFRLPEIYGPHVAILIKDIHEQKHVVNALRESGKRDAFRVALTDTVRNSCDPLDIQTTGCRMLAEYLQVNSAIYAEFNSEGEMLCEDGYSDVNARVPCNFRPWEHNPDLQEMFMAGHALSAENTFELPTLTAEQRTLCRSLGIRAYVAVPLINSAQPTAVLSVFHSEIRPWQAAEISLIKEVAERISNSLERARAEQAIRWREAELREADQRKNEFIAVLSHELRNPLAPILNAVHIIEISKPNSEEANVAHSILKRQVGLMARLIDDLLDITRIARGKIQLKSDRVELNKLVKRTLQDHSSIFQKKEVGLEFKPSTSEVWVDGDENRLCQTIGNLLQNCAKFTSPGGLTAISVSTEGQNALVRVVDSGVGMTGELLAQLFQPFIQGEATLDRSKGGLGLGLALSKRLIELHGGSILAHSDGLGEGAQFEIRLPLAGAPESEVVRPSAAVDKTPRRILIIEDNVDSANTLRDVLRMSDHEAVVAYDGPTGIELARKILPDILICDIGLPGTDGYEVARVFKADKNLRHIILVALSGYAMPEDQQRATNAGFDFHLAKPANIEKLREIFSQFRRPVKT